MSESACADRCSTAYLVGRVVGYGLTSAALVLGVIALSNRPLVTTVKLLPQRYAGGYTFHTSLLFCSVLAASLGLLIVSAVVGRGDMEDQARRVFYALDLTAVLLTAAWVALVASLLGFVMLIGSY